MIEERPGIGAKLAWIAIVLVIGVIAVGASVVVRRMRDAEEAVASAKPSASARPTSAPTAVPSGDVYALARAHVQPDPATLATKLRGAEQTIRSSDPSARDIADAAHIAQAAYRQLADRPDWVATVLEAMPEPLRPHVQAHVRAAAELRALTKPKPSLPQWRIEAPPPPIELTGHYQGAAAEFGIGWEYLAAIHLVETRMGRIRGTSSAGAQGPMQFLPSTWSAYGEGDIDNPRDAIRAAARYLKANGAPEHMDQALYAYNPSDRYVTAVTIYADEIRADPKMYAAYWHWQVYYRTTNGDALLPEGWRG